MKPDPLMHNKEFRIRLKKVINNVKEYCTEGLDLIDAIEYRKTLKSPECRIAAAVLIIQFHFPLNCINDELVQICIANAYDDTTIFDNIEIEVWNDIKHGMHIEYEKAKESKKYFKLTINNN